MEMVVCSLKTKSKEIVSRAKSLVYPVVCFLFVCFDLLYRFGCFEPDSKSKHLIMPCPLSVFTVCIGQGSLSELKWLLPY